MRIQKLSLTTMLALLVVVGASAGQNTEKPQIPMQYPLVKFEAALQESCPLELTVIGESNHGPEATLRVRNIGTKAVRAYTIVLEADPRNYLWTTLIAPIRLESGQSHNQPVTIIYPNQNKSGLVRVMFDYIEFSDGTTWGADAFQKSKDVALYKENRAIAIVNLMGVLEDRDPTDFKLALEKQPGFYIGEPVLQADEISHKVDYGNRGYQSVVVMLQRMKTHTDETAELIKKLLAMQKPAARQKQVEQ